MHRLTERVSRFFERAQLSPGMVVVDVLVPDEPLPDEPSPDESEPSLLSVTGSLGVTTVMVSTLFPGDEVCGSVVDGVIDVEELGG